VLADARWLAKISCHVLMCRSVDAGLPVRRAGRRGARPRVIAGLCDLSTAVGGRSARDRWCAGSARASPRVIADLRYCVCNGVPRARRSGGGVKCESVRQPQGSSSVYYLHSFLYDVCSSFFTNQRHILEDGMSIS
jgi:hypothetical protein